MFTSFLLWYILVFGFWSNMSPLKTNECPLKINGFEGVFLGWALAWKWVRFCGNPCPENMCCCHTTATLAATCKPSCCHIQTLLLPHHCHIQTLLLPHHCHTCCHIQTSLASTHQLSSATHQPCCCHISTESCCLLLHSCCNTFPQLPRRVWPERRYPDKSWTHNLHLRLIFCSASFFVLQRQTSGPCSQWLMVVYFFLGGIHIRCLGQDVSPTFRVRAADKIWTPSSAGSPYRLEEACRKTQTNTKSPTKIHILLEDTRYHRINSCFWFP